jgi:hypothetical protein
MSATRIGLGFAGEYALLSLIEDAPEALKVATVICAVGALIALETELWLRKRNAFIPLISALSVIYASFVSYAIYETIHRNAVLQHLQEACVQSGTLLYYPAETMLKPDGGVDQSALREYSIRAQKWAKETSDWIDNNIGIGAKERFLDYADIPQFPHKPY